MNNYMDAVNLRYTVQRVATLRKIIAANELANRDPRSYRAELLELDNLSQNLAAHPIRPQISLSISSTLNLVSLDEGLRERHGGYWYAVEAGSFAHRAFKQRSSLMRWMEERGLRLSTPLPEMGLYSMQQIQGRYREAMHSSYDLFYAQPGSRVWEMSNGSATLAIITDDEDGIRTVHTLNPNCADRPVCDLAAYNALYG